MVGADVEAAVAAVIEDTEAEGTTAVCPHTIPAQTNPTARIFPNIASSSKKIIRRYIFAKGCVADAARIDQACRAKS
jgi:hypothetical protein